jgi:hypothetical protein
MKEDYKGSHFMVPFICTACSLLVARASCTSYTFLAFARVMATFNATLFTRLCTKLYNIVLAKAGQNSDPPTTLFSP